MVENVGWFALRFALSVAVTVLVLWVYPSLFQWDEATKWEGMLLFLVFFNSIKRSEQ